ncbi:uncharacterized protein EV422DRAFT_3245 [Fimicolochytrium jonesii]|uniref:uncharacterized protein n=1 Tax=Fimicolochytrium jonesii TaxID=1396493 RepID=UPI0022FE3EF7|nr:uncharacterized protein EV422DRAFT_3245 [Fimicolochytrium jonesii]KAI8826596.1 hypothetical protein EV422DRAFT_3245 [Fimicolochytrium jonesii]
MVVRPKCVISCPSPVILPPSPQEVAYVVGHSSLPLALAERINDLFDPPPVVFNGSVAVYNLKNTFTGIEVEFRGVETEYHPSNPYIGRELVSETEVLWNSERDGAGSLSDGRHDFPFTISIPPDLPPSLKLRHAEVSYKLTVKLQRKHLYPLAYHREVVVRRGFPSSTRSSFVRMSISSNITSPPLRSTSGLIVEPARSRSDSNLSNNVRIVDMFPHVDGMGMALADPHAPQTARTEPIPRLLSSSTSGGNYSHQWKLPTTMERRTETFRGTTPKEEFEYIITLPRPLLRDDILSKVDLELKDKGQSVSTVRHLECSLRERQTFEHVWVPLTRRLTTLQGMEPAVENFTVTKHPIKYKVASDQLQQSSGGSASFPFSLATTAAAPDCRTAMLNVEHFIRIVIEYEPPRIQRPHQTPTIVINDTNIGFGKKSIWRDFINLPAFKRFKRKRIVLEIPAFISDAAADEGFTLQQSPPPLMDAVTEPEEGIPLDDAPLYREVDTLPNAPPAMSVQA